MPRNAQDKRPPEGNREADSSYADVPWYVFGDTFWLTSTSRQMPVGPCENSASGSDLIRDLIDETKTQDEDLAKALTLSDPQGNGRPPLLLDLISRSERRRNPWLMWHGKIGLVVGHFKGESCGGMMVRGSNIYLRWPFGRDGDTRLRTRAEALGIGIGEETLEPDDLDVDAIFATGHAMVKGDRQEETKEEIGHPEGLKEIMNLWIGEHFPYALSLPDSFSVSVVPHLRTDQTFLRMRANSAELVLGFSPDDESEPGILNMYQPWPCGSF